MTSEQYRVLNSSLRQFGFSVRIINGFVLAIEVSIRLLGLKKTQWLLGCLPISHNSIFTPHQQFVIMDRYTTIFNIIKSTKLHRGRCLSQSLAMQWLLLRKGIESELKIGVFIRDGAIDAHAWIEKNGRILNDHPAVIAAYKPLPVQSVKSSFRFS